MKRKLLFERLDGVTDIATITTRKEKGYYTSSIKIGTISRRINSGMLEKNDSHGAAVQALGLYKDNAVL